MPSASQPASRRPASQAQNKLVLSTLGLSGPLWASLVQGSNGRSNGRSNGPMVGPMMQWSVQWLNGPSSGPTVGRVQWSVQ